ncbi:MAG: glycine cleavage system aminomethyltransferase GcvT [Fimbriimonadales bacterium]|nr:glycine cleavage system aminomethyltransferase GcvT [Fimbriimonadales bacterium]MDW8052024.1 glycine cleavage system aminomethyltransferase GcvT [Armatimonadota bacterium]
MQRTALYEAHLTAGARMIEFAGWQMPVQYGGIVQEVRAVRQRWGVFDVSHMGRAYFRGSDARTLLNRLVPSDLGKLAPMSGVYTVLTNERGGIVDDIILYELAPDEYLVVFNAANRYKDLNWFHHWQSAWGLQVSIDDQTEHTVMLAVQGPEATARLSQLLGAPLEAVPRFGATFVEWQGTRLFAARTGYTGEDGFELIAPTSVGVALWNALLQAGATPCGLGARDVLRVEAGLHLYGHELTEDTNPIEAGLGWLVSERTDYLGAAVIAPLKQTGTPRKLMGIRLLERGVPREGYPVLIHGQPVGTLTSGVYSPTLEQGIGMAYLPAEHAKTGTPCEVEIRGKRIPAVVSTRRFLKAS